MREQRDNETTGQQTNNYVKIAQNKVNNKVDTHCTRMES